MICLIRATSASTSASCLSPAGSPSRSNSKCTASRGNYSISISNLEMLASHFHWIFSLYIYINNKYICSYIYVYLNSNNNEIVIIFRICKHQDTNTFLFVISAIDNYLNHEDVNDTRNDFLWKIVDLKLCDFPSIQQSCFLQLSLVFEGITSLTKHHQHELPFFPSD